MSMHKIDLSDLEREGLKSHGLIISKPSQLSDAFRQGMAWALAAAPQPPALGGEPETLAVFKADGSSLHQTKAGFERQLTGLDVELIDRAHLAPLQAENKRLKSAAETLTRMGYTDNGGELWRPPLGKKPDFHLIDQLKARRDELEGLLQMFIDNSEDMDVVELCRNALSKPADQQNDQIQLSEDVREYLQEGIENATGCEDSDVDYDFANELAMLLGPIYHHAQPATAKVDERVEFEKFFNDAAKRLPLIKGGSTIRYAGGQYVNDYALFGFMAWQARAKLNENN